ncbi:MAG: hypothetical protein COB46_05560 [Rhodospirillaceae bacterium]|nr:MAG: hypothetical protein COB46_05560 [Rhodospirillaceae bacterium]
MISQKRFLPYVIVFLTVFIGLIWRPFFIGFYGDDVPLAIADTFEEALFYGRRERFLYFFPIAIPRYFFGHDQISWGWYAITVAGLTAAALFSFFKAVLSKLSGTTKNATFAAGASAILYIFLPWSIAPVLWNTALSQLAMVGLLALAGTALFSRFSALKKAFVFVTLLVLSSLIYETIWGAWIPLILIKLSLDTSTERQETYKVFAAAVVAQIGLIANYLPSYGMEGRVLSGGGLKLSAKLSLFAENVFIRFPFEVLSSMGVIGLMAAPLFMFVLFKLYQRRSEFLKGPSMLLVILACVAGIMGGILVVTLGNYRITGTTDEARFLSAISIWLCLMFGMLSSLVLSLRAKNIQIVTTAVYVLIIAAFFLRASDWGRGHSYQRDVIASVPVEAIAKLIEPLENQGATINFDIEQTVLLVELGAPMHLFHGLDNSRGLQFVSQKIESETGKSVVGLFVNNRLWKTTVQGTELSRARCANPEELVGGKAVNAPQFIFWSYKTGEVRKISQSFQQGCTRTIQRYEFLGELLYPFMGNPRRQ